MIAEHAGVALETAIFSRADDNLVTDNIPLVKSLAGRYAGRGIEYEELFSAGCVGLVKAARRFEPARGNCFSTYAVPLILGEIKRLFRDGGSVHVSRSLKELSVKMSRLQSKLQSEGKQPHISELAEMCGVSLSMAAEALAVSTPVLSLSGGLCNGDFDATDGNMPETDIPVPPPQAKLTEIIALRQTLSSLEPADRRLIYLRYSAEKTQSETGRLLGMTQVQVSRRERKILAALRLELN